MGQQKVLNGEWMQWISHNLGNGCTPDSVVEAMVEGGFEQAFAEAAVQLSEKATSSTFDYGTIHFAHIGHSIRTSDQKVRISARLDKPFIIVMDNVLTDEECDRLIALSRDKLERSRTVNPSTGEDMIVEERTSWGTFFQVNEDAFISRLDRRISEIMCRPAENGEGLQILNYQVGAEYKPHFDYFEGAELDNYLGSGGQRVSTLVLYLNDVGDGGETTFPEVGLSVAPRKGSAVYFEYGNELGQLDRLSLHGGAPVKAGEKWIATKWMRQRAYTSS
ncbi:MULTISPECIES: 2OG-Fe(II) oxygenase [Cohnella]|uniref:Prolyl 4-hydroxylase n=1 Tax=Cohnella phaseoli TaxID=456490 RepID=A0A3D9IJM3_9BACL|nr:2OG-Fe(II) oxygenase [Cohnella phaseoli]RED61915.1 prolyl 4-hydroxylase [Cohnella phaseoli]